MMLRRTFGLIAALSALSGLACGGGDTSPPDGTTPGTPPAPRVASLDMPPAQYITTDTTLRLNAVLKDSTGAVVTNRRPFWSTSNPDAATVDSTGAVHGRAPGLAWIAASIDGLHAQTAVYVDPVPASFQVEPAIIPLGYDPPVRAIVKDAAGTALIMPAVIISQDVTRFSGPFGDAYLCASTNPCPIITKRVGTAGVSGGVNGRLFFTSINIIDPIVDSVVNNSGASTVTLALGVSRALSALVYAKSSAPPVSRIVSYSLQWASSNTIVATVDSLGTVTARAAGDAVVTATAVGRTMNVPVHVTAP